MEVVTFYEIPQLVEEALIQLCVKEDFEMLVLERPDYALWFNIFICYHQFVMD